MQITHRDTMSDITENTGAAITTRGVFVPTGRAPAEGERKLVLLIQVRVIYQKK
jgi:ATP-dependent RNA helicase DDX46/PRP5